MKLFNQYGPLREGEPEPGGGGGAGADPTPGVTLEAVQALVEGAVTKLTGQVNGLDKRYKKTFAELAGKFKEPDPNGDPDPTGDPVEPAGKPDQKYLALERRFEKLSKEHEQGNAERATEKQERQEEKRRASITNVVAQLGVHPSAVDDAERFFRDEVRRSDDGELVVGDDDDPFNLEYAKAEVAKREHWLPPKVVGGAGASKGAVSGSGEGFTMEQINPNMKSEDLDAVSKQIANL